MIQTKSADEAIRGLTQTDTDHVYRHNNGGLEEDPERLCLHFAGGWLTLKDTTGERKMWSSSHNGGHGHRICGQQG